MTVGDRIRKLRQQKKITQTELAEKVNTTKQNIYKYETGIISNIPYDKLELIADTLGTTPQYLLGWDDMEAQIDKYNSTDPDLIEKYNGDLDAAYAEQLRLIDEQARKDAHTLKHTKPASENPLHPETSNINCVIPQDNIYKIPVYETVSAGFGAYASNDVTDYIPVILNNHADVEDTIAIKVKGDSMYPKIEDGDIIIVRKQDSVDSGDIAVLLLDGDEGLVKKVVYGETWIELHSINPEYKTRRFEGEEVLRLRVVGLVKQIIKTL